MIPWKSSSRVLLKQNSLNALSGAYAKVFFWVMAYIEFSSSFTVAALDIFRFFFYRIQTLKFGLQE